MRSLLRSWPARFLRVFYAFLHVFLRRNSTRQGMGGTNGQTAPGFYTVFIAFFTRFFTPITASAFFTRFFTRFLRVFSFLGQAGYPGASSETGARRNPRDKHDTSEPFRCANGPGKRFFPTWRDVGALAKDYGKNRPV